MKPRQNRPRLSSRVSTVVGIGALVAVAMAARSQGGQQTPPPSAPPSTAPAQPATVPAADAPADSMAQDSTTRTDTTAVADSMAMPDSTMTTPVAAAPTAQATGTWPVDPVTGQTIINGEPVVGRVFIMQKPDGLVKLGTWQAQYNGEPATPEPARVGTSYTVPAPEHTRRMRGIMIQSTLWAMDGKRSARERRFYRPQTTDEALGRQ
jgi:cytoskeletal protein RodZ